MHNPKPNPQSHVLDTRRRLASNSNSSLSTVSTTTFLLNFSHLGPNERRCIARQDFGHQRRLIVGAVYTSTADTSNAVLALKQGKTPFFHALRYCIDAHPLLSTVILNADTEAPEFATPKSIDLDAHLEIVDA